MYIITILDILKNSVEIFDAYNNELDAQNEFLNITESNAKPNEKENIYYECLMISKNMCYVYSRENGWTYNTKKLYKIISLHTVKDYDIIDSNQ